MPSPGVSGAISRNSPAIHGDDVIVGDIEAGFGPHNGANIIAADRRTGALHWITKVDSHVAAVITGSPVVFGNVAYVGVSSQEEALALLDNPAPIPPFAIYHCCTFRGSVVALDANTGKLLWKTYVMPENGGNPGGYSGGAIWQPPAIDPIRRQLYIGTVNNYSAPKSVLDCETQAIADNNPDADCTAPDDFFETALALDQVGPGGNTGGIQWGTATDGWRV